MEESTLKGQETMSNTLEACPFCGSDDLHLSSNGIGSHYVTCEQCGAEGPAAPNTRGAQEAWSTRSSIPKERLLRLLTREDIKAANRKGFDPLVYEGMRKIIQELREAIGSMEGKG